MPKKKIVRKTITNNNTLFQFFIQGKTNMHSKYMYVFAYIKNSTKYKSFKYKFARRIMENGG